MVAQIIRAAVVAAATSAIGYAVMAYRNSRALKQQEAHDKLAVQEWETDGGSNIASSVKPEGVQGRVF